MIIPNHKTTKDIFGKNGFYWDLLGKSANKNQKKVSPGPR
jgi:hypothetical protein